MEWSDVELMEKVSEADDSRGLEAEARGTSKILVFLALAFLISVLALLCAEYHVSRLERTLDAPAAEVS